MAINAQKSRGSLSSTSNSHYFANNILAPKPRFKHSNIVLGPPELLVRGYFQGLSLKVKRCHQAPEQPKTVSFVNIDD